MIETVQIGDGAAPSRGLGATSAEQIGAKAANLARMAALGLRVPPAFVLPVSLCGTIAGADQRAQRELTEALSGGIAFLENATGKRFGDRRRPLLVSVRSGAARSMPGMLDTVLNVGCTPAATRGLIRMTGNPRFAWDCRRRFLEAYGQTVLGLDPARFAATLDHMVHEECAEGDRDLDCEALERLASAYENLTVEIAKETADNPMAQLAAAVLAVYGSWTGDRARKYRSLEKLDHLPGTAVTVQAMVFGNRGAASGTGVAFSRNPSTGAPQPMIDVLFDAQGEDVVSGRRTPETEAELTRAMPAIATELHDILTRLERVFGDVQDIEFTIEDGRLWILQTRAAKRTPRAALRIAMDLVREGLITKREAMRRLDGLNLAALAITRFAEPGPPAAQGIGAAGGVSVGRAAFDSQAAERLAACGDPVILLRPEMSTGDIAGIAVSAGIVTTTGGRTAHAALVARQEGKPCIVGCEQLAVDASAHRAKLAGVGIEEGDWISIDGDSGGVFLGRRNVVIEQPEAELAEISRWREPVESTQPA